MLSRWILIPICVTIVVAAGVRLPAQELTSTTYDQLRAAINVKPEELRWQQISWRSFWEGLVEAQRLDRPIFYWTYFGDPRGGC